MSTTNNFCSTPVDPMLMDHTYSIVNSLSLSSIDQSESTYNESDDYLYKYNNNGTYDTNLDITTHAA